MKINGQKISGKNIVTVFIPRSEKDGIEFKCQAITDTEKFNQLCPEPKPPMLTRPGKQPAPDFTDKKYIKEVEDRNKQFIEYLILQSLKATEGLEWETVNEDNPETWGNYSKELVDADFSANEISMVINGVLKANTLDEDHVRKAHEAFLLSRSQTKNEE